MVSILKYLMVFTCGLLIGYGLFTAPSQLEVESIPPENNAGITQKNEQMGVPGQTDATTQASELDQMQKIIASQKIEIAQLRRLLSQKATDQVATDMEEDAQQKQIQKMSGDELNELMKAHFIEQFRDYAIEVSPEDAASMQERLQANNQQNDWSVEQQTNITNFIQDNNADNLHSIDDLYCNRKTCHLSVTTSDADNWETIYFDMTRQSWYQAMTMFVEDNDNSRFSYYIQKIDI